MTTHCGAQSGYLVLPRYTEAQPILLFPSLCQDRCGGRWWCLLQLFGSAFQSTPEGGPESGRISSFLLGGCGVAWALPFNPCTAARVMAPGQQLTQRVFCGACCIKVGHFSVRKAPQGHNGVCSTRALLQRVYPNPASRVTTTNFFSCPGCDATTSLTALRFFWGADRGVYAIRGAWVILA